MTSHRELDLLPDTGERVVNRDVTAFCLDGYHVWHGEQSNKDVTAFYLDGYTHVTDT